MIEKAESIKSFSLKYTYIQNSHKKKVFFYDLKYYT